jgi:hypothetical protein
MENGRGFEPGETLESRNLRIKAKLAAGFLPVLPFERAIIERQLEAVKEEQDDMGRELSVVNHQSSETWHDNFAANEVERYSKVVHTKGTRLVDTLSRTVEFGLPPEGDEVTLGSFLELKFGDSDTLETAFLTGTSSDMDVICREVELEDYEITPITLKSPVGSALLGSRAGETVQYMVGDRVREAHVLSVRQLSFD